MDINHEINEADLPYYAMRLRAELARRREANSNYSLRAFAKALGIQASTLSRVLSHKRRLTFRNARQIVEHLNLPEKERTLFFSSISSVYQAEPARGPSRPGTEGQPDDLLQIQNETFEIISDVLHYVILELTHVKGFQSDTAWIAAKTGRPHADVEQAIDRLVRVGLLVWHQGQLRKCSFRVTTKDKRSTSEALKNHQRQVLGEALRALDEAPLERRSMTSMTVAIAPRQLPVARKLIEEFTNNLCDVLSGGGQEEEVYQLTIGLFPMTGDGRPEAEPKPRSPR